MNLTLVHSRDYARPVTANSVAGFGDPTGYGATAPTQHQALFCACRLGVHRLPGVSLWQIAWGDLRVCRVP